MPKRVVAIGDLHGDLAALVSALKAVGAVDDTLQWTGGDLVVVQTGDQLDRGDDEVELLDYIAKLEVQARAAGGDFIMLLGNHELMNAAGDFRYVTRGAIHDFDHAAGALEANYAHAPEPVRKRLAALGPGGTYAKKLAAHGVIVIVGDTIFAHAGVAGDWVTQIEAVNQSSRCWLDGQAGKYDQPPPALASDESPVWTRVYGSPEPDCAAAAATLKSLGLKRMVVGHTVQQTMNAACDDTVWRIDVGLGKLYDGPIQVLELTPDKPPRVITGKR